MTEQKGEGSYEGTRKFQKAQHEFAASDKVAKPARQAADALDSKEAEGLERARVAAAKGRSVDENAGDNKTDGQD